MVLEVLNLGANILSIVLVIASIILLRNELELENENMRPMLNMVMFVLVLSAVAILPFMSETLFIFEEVIDVIGVRSAEMFITMTELLIIPLIALVFVVLVSFTKSVE